MQMRERLEAAYDAAFPFGTYRQRGQTGAQSDRQRDKFRRLLDAEAWLDAAMMLVPEWYDWSLNNFDGHLGKPCAWLCKDWPFHIGEAATPAEALLAAIEKARTV